MPARSSHGWWQVVVTQARAAGLVAAAVALGAGGALALANPQHLPTSATSAGTTATPRASVTTTDSATSEPTAEPTRTLADEDAGTKLDADAGTPTDGGTADTKDASKDGGPAAGRPSAGRPSASARGGGAALAPVTCEDAVNHGAYVSSVARSAYGTGEDAGPDHGKAVREAARSDCGKPKAAAGGTPGERDPSEAGSGRGHTDAPGKGHEKGRGKGHDEDS